ncbi:MAG: helix-turn-helix domain-containing protein [Acidobacteria bacterium]|nr:helix-turn-helix domain-containing protein [Acidobacteriota bacterium]
MSQSDVGGKYERVFDPKVPVARAAQYLNVSLATTWRLIWTGKLQSYQVGGRILIGLSHLEAFLKDSQERSGKRFQRFDSK